MNIMENYQPKRIVVKAGTGCFYDIDDNGSLIFRDDQLDGLIEELCSINEKMDVGAVFSGAIATAAYRMGLEIPTDHHEKAGFAAVGQPLLMAECQKRCKEYGIWVAQFLLCRDDIENRIRRRNLRIVQELIFRQKNRLTICNENDTVSREEITFGDNDILAAHYAGFIDADLVIMLSYPVEGLGTGGGESKRMARNYLEEREIPMEILNGKYEKDPSGVYQPRIRKLLEV